jgi:hypothetical protein
MRLALIAAAALLAAPAQASSPAAEAEGNREAQAACLKAADLRDAKISGRAIAFSDDTGKTAMLVTGRWKPAHMNGARATMLCLYDRRSKRAEAQEAYRWPVK